MAGQPGYYMVALSDGSAGVVKVAANLRPVTVGGHHITSAAYLGASEQDILANWDKAIGQIGAAGLFELGPPGSGQAIIGSSTDAGTLIHYAETRGAGILSKTPNAAEWDPTFTAIAGGLGGIVSGAVRASAAAAAGAASGADAGAVNAATGVGGATAGGGVAAGVGKVAGKVAAGAATVAGAVGLTALFGNVELWKGIGLIIAGVLILLIAGRELVKL